MSIARQQLGISGERVAERWLNAHGWQVAERRFRTGHRDIDLIATRSTSDSGRTVAFVEVKTRRTNSFGGPIGAVGWRKQRELIRSAKVWIARHRQPSDTFRFDVIGVILGSKTPRVQHIENAFLVSAKRS